MTHGLKVLAGLLAVLSLSAFEANAGTAPAPDGLVTKKVSDGLIKGQVVDGVLSFKGIPYAAPPVGDLRWRAPQPPVQWQGVRDATAFAPDCKQKAFPGDPSPQRTVTSEDCLYLNVWRLANIAPKAKLPVIVWIYGGGFVVGGTSPAIHDGTAFARDGVIFVSMNYRLGRFGFFGFPALTKADADHGLLGNYGYMDQIKALRWVKANIAALGGDPDNVTIFGESAGGGSVNALMTSPETKGLFNRIGVMSGGGRSALNGQRFLTTGSGPRPSSETLGVNFAKANGIDGDGPEALKALRALDADKVMDGVGIGQSSPDTYGGPMIDGRIVVEDPQTAYLAGHHAPVPVMVGATSGDLGFFSAKTKDEAFQSFGANADQARAAYDPTGSDNDGAVIRRIGRDRVMVEPARFIARTISTQGFKAYYYRFSYITESRRAKSPDGAGHATDIPYVFDSLDGAGFPISDADRAMAKATHAIWVAYAKTGVPTGWPTYDAKKDLMMDFAEDGKPVVKPDPWKARMDLTESAASK
jgi:para-nitrobenzyl esterase